MEIRSTLTLYIEEEVIPRYASFDMAHREDHARSVIARALAMAVQYPEIDTEMLYTAAACHDLGLSVDRKTHHLESGKIIRADARLREWFTPQQIEVIAQAAEDHRASATTPPRSLYGRLVAEADRLIVPETVIQRTIQFGLSNYPQLDQEGHWQRFMQHIGEKYSAEGKPIPFKKVVLNLFTDDGKPGQYYTDESFCEDDDPTVFYVELKV